MSSAVSRSVSILRTDMDSLLNYLVSLCFRGKLLGEGEGEIDVLGLNFCPINSYNWLLGIQGNS